MKNKEITLEVDGMKCENCAQTVRAAVEGIEGVENADVDLTAGEVRVVYEEGKANITSIKSAITKAGYKVK